MKAESASKIIDQVYNCVQQPAAWPDFLQTISHRGENAGSSIVIYDRHNNRRSQLFEHGANQSHLRVYFEKLAAMKLMPSARSQLSRLGDIATMTMLCGEQETLEHEFYIRWIKPSGFRDMIGLMVLKSGRRLAWFSVARTEIQARYGASDMEFMDMLSPHICRAFSMADMFEMQDVRIQQLEQVVDALSTGVLLTDQGGITYMNRSAEQLINRSAVLQIKKNHLTIEKGNTAEKLSHAINSSLRGLAPEKAGLHLVPIPDMENRGMIASVLPLSWRDCSNPLNLLPGAAAVLIQDTVQPQLPAGEAFGQLYGLTPAELRVSLVVARGLTPQDISLELGVSPNTTKTHLQRIFAKTNTARQAELARLIMTTIPPIRTNTD